MLQTDESRPNLNERAAELADRMVADAADLGIRCKLGRLGNREIDCGLNAPGSVAAGLRLAEICLGGLAEVSLEPAPADFPVTSMVVVRSDWPILACLASQYAGWHFEGAAEGQTFSVLGSGPARAIARREPIFDDIDHREQPTRAVLVLETENVPQPAIVTDLARGCNLPPEQLIVLYAPTRSMAGCVQVAARAIECALQKARLLEFPLHRVVKASGSAPLCTPYPDSVVAMGRTNDAIIYGARVELSVTGPAAEARHMAEALPSRTSVAWGRSFAEVYREHDGDFRSIEPGFFSPAKVAVQAQETGETFRAGNLSPDLLAKFLA